MYIAEVITYLAFNCFNGLSHEYVLVSSRTNRQSKTENVASPVIFDRVLSVIVYKDMLIDLGIALRSLRL